jgi:endoglucanase
MTRHLLAAVFLAVGALLGPAHAQQRPITPEPDSDFTSYGTTSFSSLHGINLGNFLEAPVEGGWSGGRLLQESDFANIRNAGFTLIRVPISWPAHIGPAPDYKIDPAFLARIDWVVAQAEKNNLIAILDYHNDDKLMKDPDANAAHFLAIWKQVAKHFKDAPISIWFELLNEPNGKLDETHWNNLIAATLPFIRASNHDRTVVVGPAWWNGIWALPKLVLSDNDTNLVVTFHYYDPMHFTHQGASWIGPESQSWLGTTWDATPEQVKAISDSFDKAAAWGSAHHRLMYLGEFGSFSTGDMASRARWTTAVVQAATQHHFLWSYWEYCAGFGAYDPEAKQWRQPLLDALLPK